MIASIKIAEKSFGDKLLYSDLKIAIERGEKIGLIGRNGTGKSTLFNLITGEDTDFDGEITLSKNTALTFSRQEHHGFEEMTVLEYILGDLPEYARLKHILETYPQHMGEDLHRQQVYSDALERFSDLGYYEIENDIERIFADYQMPNELIGRTLRQLSGGQKRMVELVKIQRAKADIALIDEPTNHMDYVAKASFISWLKAANEAVVVIAHDRDVLGVVDRIIEIRDHKALSFPGNYTQYLAQNMVTATSGVMEYENAQRQMANLQIKIKNARTHKLQAPPDQAKKWRILENRLIREYEKLATETEKPTLWIDRESVDDLGTKLAQSYQQHKARNIRVRTKKAHERSERTLISVRDIALGYGESPLFQAVNFELRVGNKVQLKGRNGVGKTTLIQTILQTVKHQKPTPTVFEGYVETDPHISIGVYEQEISRDYLALPLGEAIEQMYVARGLSITPEKVNQLLSDYLFNPHTDAVMKLEQLSGGQKARFQLIAMLAGDPQVLILDEPTNHLDLPSIEELEDALGQYDGAILYISHDSYFAKQVGGEVVELKQAQ